MAIDNKELIKLNPEIISGTEKAKSIQEIQQAQEKSRLETGESTESDKVGGREQAYYPTADPSTTAYSPANDPNYQAYKQIEGILSEDLGEMYNKLTPKDQQIFKAKGEETARSIFQLVYGKTKIKVKKIIKLIRNWLKVIPGINKFFLEQEAKIKTDKILGLTQDDKKIRF
jgi:hypothetical protein